MNKKNLFSIGDVAKMFHLSVSSLRHYEKAGLLTPAYVSGESGYRYYSAEQFEVLNTIRYLRTLDMPIAEIEDFLKNRDVDRIEEKLRQQKEIVLQKQKDLKRIEKKIDHRLCRLRDARKEPLDTVSLVRLEACQMIWMDEPLQIDNFLDMETPIRKIDRSEAEAIVFLGKVGLGILAEHLRAGQTSPYDGIFLLLDQEDVYTGDVLALPETLCVRIRFRGSHREAPAQYEKLFRYIEKNRLQITGFSREITLIDYGITNDQEKFVTEICIPVQNG